MQRDQQQQDRHRLNRDLRQRQIRRREVDKGTRDTQADNTDQNQRQEPLAVVQDNKRRCDHHGHPPSCGYRGDWQSLARDRADTRAAICDVACRQNGNHEDCQIATDRAIVQRPVKGRHGPLNRAIESIKNHFRLRARHRVPKTLKLVMQGEQDQTTDHRADGHKQGRREAMPNLEGVIRQLPADDRLPCRGHQRPRNQGGEEADQNNENDQEGGRGPHPKPWIMRHMRIVIPLWPKKDMNDQTERIGDRE